MTSPENIRSRLAWREAGAGETVLFLHAYPFSAQMWEAQLAAMPDGWRGIAVDLPGFGGSAGELRAGLDASLDGYAHGVVEVLDALELKSVVVCGLSMGGYTALSLMRLHPERVRALVLCDTRATADTPEGRVTRLEQARSIRAEGMDAVVDTMLPKLITRMNRLSNPAMRSQVEEMMRATAPEAAARALTAMAHRPDSTELLRAIDVPVMIVVGAEDEITPPGDAQMMARGIRGARLEVIPDAGHLSNVEQPALFNTALHAFLRSLPR